MKTVLVTGASGQLGKCFQKQAIKFPNFKFLFCSSKELDITSEDSIRNFFTNHQIDFCINCAAYTNVELAEDEKKKAFLVNADSVKILAGICKENNAVLIHFSTDYVFNGEAKTPYKEEDKIGPINIYGSSKLLGEEYISSVMDRYFIFRTSWLYSEFGHNFFNTIRKKIEEGAELNITTSQVGTPTNGNDLAWYILKIISDENTQYGIYHFSNEGEATWYDFAKAIIVFSEKTEKIKLNKTGFYPTKAQRPEYSVLSKEKAKSEFGHKILDWKESLKQLIAEN